VGEIEAYASSSRAMVVRRAQRQRLYQQLPEIRFVTEITRRVNPVVRWSNQAGVVGERTLDDLTVAERMLLYIEGPRGPEPLWLWLNERGLPFQVHSWDGVFATANRRCERVLPPPDRVGLDPHQVFAPYATPHSARHSYATALINAGVSLQALMALLGHRSANMAMIYGTTPKSGRANVRRSIPYSSTKTEVAANMTTASGRDPYAGS
jgi:hypothetical protein